MKAGYDAAFYHRRDARVAASAARIASILIDLAAPSSVVDVGCGLGTWLQAFRTLGVADVLGVEGSWVEPGDLLIPRDRFLAHDLREPLHLDRTFDLAISVEVAEHLPPDSAEAFVTSLTDLAPLVLFSAAVPHQGGTHHVNEQWPEYWNRLFAAAGYAVADAIRPRVWNDPAVKVWYAQNTLLFVREAALDHYAKLGPEISRTDPERLAIVHPRLYQRNSDPRHHSLRTALRVLPELFIRALRRRITRPSLNR
jgi:SAM-dependent methyltransferase